MKNGMVIIDADGHAVDYEPVYRERLPEKYRNRATIYPADNFDRTQNGALAAKRGSHDEAFRYYRAANTIRQRLLAQANLSFDADKHAASD